MKKFQGKYFAIFLAVPATIIGALAVANIPVELAEEYRGVRNVQGTIIDCDFDKLNDSNSKIYVGITLDSSDQLFRMNPSKKKRIFYIEMCNEKPKVSIEYHAAKRLVGPVSFWINNLDEI